MTTSRRPLVLVVAWLTAACSGPVVGDPCSQHSDCGGGAAVCDRSKPGGSCTFICRFDHNCGPGSVCDATDAWGGRCLPSCSSPGTRSGCRIGYRCEARADDRAVCLPEDEPHHNVGAGGGSGGSGGAAGGSGGLGGGGGAGGAALPARCTGQAMACYGEAGTGICTLQTGCRWDVGRDACVADRTRCDEFGDEWGCTHRNGCRWGD